MLHAVGYAAHQHMECLPEFVTVEICNGAGLIAFARIVDQAVESTKSVDCLGHHGLHFAFLCDIDCEKEHIASKLVLHFAPASQVSSGKQHLGALTHECCRDAVTDTS